MSNLKDKVALVSGSGRGIGRAIALKLARHGAKVVVNDLDEEPGRAVAAEIKASGGEAVALNGSVSDPGFADRFVGAAMEKVMVDSGAPFNALPEAPPMLIQVLLVLPRPNGFQPTLPSV